MASIQIHTRIDEIGRSGWQQCVSGQDAFLHFDYLHALEQHHCVGPELGWHPQHLSISEPQSGQASGTSRFEAVMPLYLKDHSRGEFVFDWGWARAAQSAGMRYYPRLVTCIPYTPVTGPRLGCRSAAAARQMLEGIRMAAEQHDASSWHLLFADSASAELLHSCGSDLKLLERRDCHFIWFNRGYRDFDDYLHSFSSRKRKNIKRERRRVREQKVTLQRYPGSAIDETLLDSFYRFYQLTYHRRGQPPYLNHGFFDELRLRLGDRLMLVVAEQDRHIVGTALFIESGDSLCGRWWGGSDKIDCLHFEACYYQGIEYAIERRLSRFDPGIQGEHKLLRGFEPEQTRSLHWIREPALANAVEHWLQGERRQIDYYQQQARDHLPFRRG